MFGHAAKLALSSEPRPAGTWCSPGAAKTLQLLVTSTVGLLYAASEGPAYLPDQWTAVKVDMIFTGTVIVCKLAQYAWRTAVGCVNRM